MHAYISKMLNYIRRLIMTTGLCHSSQPHGPTTLKQMLLKFFTIFLTFSYIHVLRVFTNIFKVIHVRLYVLTSYSVEYGCTPSW